MEILLRRCPEDLNLIEFKKKLVAQMKLKEYKGYRVFIPAVEDFENIWEQQSNYPVSYKDTCFFSCNQKRLFALISEQ